jgi:hypothetical protein
MKNNLFQEPKHEKKLGDAVWLYGYLLTYANMSKGELNFYLYTYCKRLEKEKELIKSQLKLLEAEGYIVLKYNDGSQYKIQINKPIKTK